MKRKFLVCSLVLASMFLSNGVSKGAENFDSLIGEREVVVLNNKEELLYKQFKSQDLAIKFAKEHYGKVLNILKLKNRNLGELSEKNWENYYELVRTVLLDDNESDLIMLRKFFDIFENKYKNDQIKSKVNMLKQNRSVDDYDSELTVLMPSNSGYSNEYNQSNMQLSEKTEKYLEQTNIKPISMQRAQISNLPFQSLAIKYAEKHAKSPNTSKYYYFSNGDCANFVSQIFEAGGRKQIVYSGGYTKSAGGWWHITNPHRHSPAWSMANTFVHYFGTHMTTKNHRVFSSQLHKGSVIAFDDYDDGDWDHVAYVTDADNYTANYNGKSYYDYKVAQHTKNYLNWASSTENGWENLENQGARYAVVRD